MSWLSSFLHPGRAYEKAQKELDKHYQEGRNYLQPYNEFGKNAYGNYSNAMNSLLNPDELLGKWMESYEESPSAKFARDSAKEHGLDAASAMGLMGSNTALNALQGGMTQIGLEDRNNYLDNLMQKYLAGANIAGNIFNTGAGTAGQMGQNAMNMGQNSAQLAYNREAAGGNMMNGLLGLGGSIVGSALGGPMGGALANRWNLSGKNPYYNKDEMMH